MKKHKVGKDGGWEVDLGGLREMGKSRGVPNISYDCMKF